MTNTITLQFPTDDSYSITGHTITLTPYTPIESVVVTENVFWKGGGIKGVLENGTGQIAIRVDLFDSVDFSGMRAGGWQNSVTLSRIGFNSNAYGGSLYGLYDTMPAANFYGHMMDGVRFSDCVGIYARNMRRACDTGTLYITRDMHQSQNKCLDMNGGGVGSHHGDRIYIHDNICINITGGIVNRAKNFHVYRNTVVSNEGVSGGNTGVVAPTSINNMGKCSITDNNITINGAGFTRNGVLCSLGYDQLKIQRNTINGVNGDPIVIRAFFIKELHIDGNICTLSGTGDGSL
jgi:hypothetical protein